MPEHSNQCPLPLAESADWKPVSCWISSMLSNRTRPNGWLLSDRVPYTQAECHPTFSSWVQGFMSCVNFWLINMYMYCRGFLHTVCLFLFCLHIRFNLPGGMAFTILCFHLDNYNSDHTSLCWQHNIFPPYKYMHSLPPFLPSHCARHADRHMAEDFLYWDRQNLKGN